MNITENGYTPKRKENSNGKIKPPQGGTGETPQKEPIVKNKILQILVDNLKISESGFSGELQISGIFKSAEEIERYIKENK